MKLLQLIILVLILNCFLLLKCEMVGKFKIWYQNKKNIFHKKSKMNKMFLIEDNTFYPGTNKEYRKIHQDAWNKYYECLRKRELSLRTSKIFVPEIYMVSEGRSIRLECKLCLSPEERDQRDSIIWVVSLKGQKYMEPIELTEHIIINPKDKSLYMYDITTDQTGEYSCLLGNSLAPVYFLTIVDDSEPIRTVNPLTAPNARHAALDEQIKDINRLYLTTIWEPWSPCSNCGKIGKKNRFGFCTIKYQYKNNTTDNTEMMIDVNQKNPLEAAINLVKLFRNGIPCRSHITPPVLLKNNQIKYRPSEIMNAFCFEECSGQKTFEVRDQFGNVIERANNSAGIYSMMQGIPNLNPSIQRVTVYGYLDRPILIKCPGNLNTDAPISWQIGEKIIIPRLLAIESKGRIYVTNKDRIRIKKLKMKDTNVYSCWQNKELAGTVRLQVTKKLQLNFTKQIKLLGAFLIIATFLYVFFKAIFDKKYY